MQALAEQQKAQQLAQQQQGGAPQVQAAPGQAPAPAAGQAQAQVPQAAAVTGSATVPNTAVLVRLNPQRANTLLHTVQARGNSVKLRCRSKSRPTAVFTQVSQIPSQIPCLAEWYLKQRSSLESARLTFRELEGCCYHVTLTEASIFNSQLLV